MHRLRWRSFTEEFGRYHVAVTRLPPRIRTSVHAQDFHEFFLVLEGSGTHLINGRPTPLRPGMLVFVGSNDHHAFSTGPAAGLDFVNVAVSARWRKLLPDLVDLPPNWDLAGHPPGHTTLDAASREYLRSLIFRLMEPRCPPETLVAVWAQAALRGARSHATEPGPPAWLEALRRDLARPELLPEPITFWQQRSGRSPEHLARSCRRFYGAPLNELLNRARIDRVRYLLQTTDGKITSIAFEVGYNNLAHFYRVFERLTGQTPHAWRKRSAHPIVPGL